MAAPEEPGFFDKFSASKPGELLPAYAAGLKKGDVITSVDGTEVADARALTYRLTTRGIGSRARLRRSWPRRHSSSRLAKLQACRRPPLLRQPPTPKALRCRSKKR